MVKVSRSIRITISVIGIFLMGFSALAQNQEPPPVKIGGVYPLTGPFAPLGEVDKNAILLAVEQINAQGGIKSLGGAKIEKIRQYPESYLLLWQIEL